MENEVKILKALADGTRIRIIQCLLDGEKCACSIVPNVNRAQPTVSQHLKILEEAGVLESRRVGTNIWYKIKSKKARQIMEILDIKKIKSKMKC
jgi:ArsR family transcriptional regulator